MSDIVERLRACAEHREMWSTGLANQAADEIAKLRAEVERLRAALEEIASGKYSGIVLTSFPPQDPAVNRARAAITGQETGR